MNEIRNGRMFDLYSVSTDKLVDSVDSLVMDN